MDLPNGVVDFVPDPTLYPFESHWFDSSVGPVHYIDEGSGPPILLLHGNPDWSFLYRKIVVGLRDDYRCIAPDYPGFGLSVNPVPRYSYTPGEHASVISELVDHLGLDQMVVVGQDWGGHIGLDVASRAPDRVRGLVMGNSTFWPAEDLMPMVFSKALGSQPFQRLIMNRNFFINVIMKRTVRASLSDEEWAHYTDVVRDPELRKGIAEFPKQILAARPWLGDLERRIADTLRDKPTLLIFGMKDPLLARPAVIERWRTAFPKAHLVELHDAGHYFQEDAPDEVVRAIRDILQGW